MRPNPFNPFNPRLIPPSSELAIIINAGTKDVSTLALLSVLRYARMPVVLIDCESRDGSFERFLSLQQQYAFHLVSAPLQPHGLLLDWVFQNLTCDLVLLVDSDSELLNADLLDQMRAKLEQGPKVFGSGYLHPGQWMDYHYGTGLALAKGIGFYHSRPWIPFVMFRVECVRRILASGSSFIDRLVYDDIPGAPRLSRLLSIRFRLGFFRQHPLTRRPAYIYYDTGARLYEDLLRRGFEFGSVSNAAEVPWSVNHLGGVTRSALQDHHDAHLSTDAAVLARRRLKAEYGLDYSYGDREV